MNQEQRKKSGPKTPLEKLGEAVQQYMEESREAGIMVSEWVLGIYGVDLTAGDEEERDKFSFIHSPRTAVHHAQALSSKMSSHFYRIM